MQYIFVPADSSLPLVVRNTTQSDPFKLYEEAGIGPYGYGERVRTSHTGVFLMVDGDGHLKGLPHNARASRFYQFPPYICGDALVIYTHESGPDWSVADWPRPNYASLLIDVLNS